MLRRKQQPAALGGAHRGGRAPLAAAAPPSHLDEDERAVALAQDQVDLATPGMRAGGDSIIALHQFQAGAQQVRERAVLPLLAAGLGREHGHLVVER